MIEIWLDNVIGDWWENLIALYHQYFWFFAIFLIAWMLIIRHANKIRYLALETAKMFILEQGEESKELTGEQLFHGFLPILREVASKQKFMPSLGGLWITKTKIDNFHVAVRITPDTMRYLRDQVHDVGKLGNPSSR